MAIVGWILLGLLGVILLLLFLPVRIKVECLDGWRGQVLLFGVIPVFSFPVPPKKEDKSPQPAPPSQESADAASEEKKPSVADDLKALFREEGVGGVLSFLKRLLALLKGTLASIVRFITVRKLALCVRVGGEEADDIAVTYGKLSAALSVSLTALSQVVRVRRPCVHVVPDFTSEKTDVRLRMIVWVWPFGVLGAGIAAVFKLLVLWFKTMKTPQSGVCNTENQKPVS